jgi:hypothetical protein
MRVTIASGVFLALLLSGGSPPLHGKEGSPAYDPVVFEFWNPPGVLFITNSSRTAHKHQPETMVSGLALLDYNNDGLLDIYAINGATMTGLEKISEIYFNRLFRNRGDGTFEDVTEKAGVKGRGYNLGTAVGDFDNDGDADIFVAGLRENILYQNNGDGTFADVTTKAGLALPDPQYKTLWSVAAAWVDYDKDGWLDLFVSNYCIWDPEKEPICGDTGQPDYCHPRLYHGLPNSLFKNNRDGTFTDVSGASGIRKHIGKGMGIGVADFDGDGWIDLFGANDTVPNFLFRNKGDGTFTEMGVEAGVAYTDRGLAVSGMGVDARDLDNDGKPDIFECALVGETMPFFRNLGEMMFEDKTLVSTLAAATLSRTGWSNGIFDFNNDGWKDLFAAFGDVMDPNGTFRERVPQPNGLFVNLKNGKFADASPTAGSEFASRKAVHRGSAFGDIDNDGRIDAVVTALDGPMEVWRNVSPTPNHWILLYAIGTKSNRDAVGTKFKVVASSGTQYNHVNSAVGYGCASDRRVHFGLGKDNVIKELHVTWPNGNVQVLENVKADQILTLKEP